MRKILQKVVVVLAGIMLCAVSVFADNLNSYSAIIDEYAANYGVFQTDEYSRLYGLIYGEFIDFDNNGTDEMLLIYHDKGEETDYDATAVVYATVNGQLSKVFEENVYSYLGQTDAGNEIRIKRGGEKTYLAVNSNDLFAENGDIETVSVFTMTNGVAEQHEYYGEVLPWWDTYEFVYTKCMIDGREVSKEEYEKDMTNFYIDTECLMLWPSEEEYSYGIHYCTQDGLMRFMDKAKNKSMSQQEDEISGTLQERFIKDGMGYDVQCLILTLDKPHDFQITDMFGEKYDVFGVEEIQVGIKNYDSSMIGANIRVKSYEDIFEAHTMYHIRPVIMVGVVAEAKNRNITVTLDGKEIEFDENPIIVDNRTLVPLRAIFEGLGATVDWDGETQTVVSKKGETTVKMTIGSVQMYKNGKLIELDVPPQLSGNRTLVPVRAVAESFDCSVDWNGETYTVVIETSNK